MTVISFYRRSLWLPIALPLVVTALQGAIPAGQVKESLGLLPLSLVFGGAPYAIAAVILFLWMSDKPPRKVRRISFVFPLALAIVITLVFSALGLVGTAAGGHAAADALNLGVVFGLFTLLIGYPYVLLVELIRIAAVRLRLVDPLPSSGTAPATVPTLRLVIAVVLVTIPHPASAQRMSTLRAGLTQPAGLDSRRRTTIHVSQPRTYWLEGTVVGGLLGLIGGLQLQHQMCNDTDNPVCSGSDKFIFVIPTMVLGVVGGLIGSSIRKR